MSLKSSIQSTYGREARKIDYDMQPAAAASATTEKETSPEHQEKKKRKKKMCLRHTMILPDRRLLLHLL